jgi:EF-hand domain pair
MDNIRPLVEYFRVSTDDTGTSNNDGSRDGSAVALLPPLDATRPAKELVLQVYHKEIWLSLPPFDEMDTDRSDFISRKELAVALAKVLEIDPSDELIDDTLKAFDGNGDGSISRTEYEACLSAIRRNRFDWTARDACAKMGETPRAVVTVTPTTVTKSSPLQPPTTTNQQQEASR